MLLQGGGGRFVNNDHEMVFNGGKISNGHLYRWKREGPVQLLTEAGQAVGAPDDSPSSIWLEGDNSFLEQRQVSKRRQVVK